MYLFNNRLRRVGSLYSVPWFGRLCPGCSTALGGRDHHRKGAIDDFGYLMTVLEECLA